MQYLKRLFNFIFSLATLKFPGGNRALFKVPFRGFRGKMQIKQFIVIKVKQPLVCLIFIFHSKYIFNRF